MGIGQYAADLVNAPAQRRAGQTAAQGKIDAVNSATPLIQNALDSQKGIWGQTAGLTDSALSSMEQANQDYWSKDPSKFDDSAYTGDAALQKYLDPSMAFRMQRGVGALDASAAAQGGLFSSGHGNEVTDYAQGLASTEYGKANDRMMQARNNAYQQYDDFLKNQQSKRQGQMDMYGKQLSTGMQGKQNLSEQQGNFDTANIQNRMDSVNAYAEKEANRQANANSSQAAAWGLGGSLLDTGAQAAGSYYGAKAGASKAVT
jgi:hypothetical protein